jgi:hypothetical protein
MRLPIESGFGKAFLREIPMHVGGLCGVPGAVSRFRNRQCVDGRLRCERPCG